METIETNRCILKIVEPSDAKNVFEILNKPNIIENLNMNIFKNIDDAKLLIKNYLEELENKTKYPYKIIDKETGNFIGIFLIKLDLYDDDCYESTVYLNENYWGKGICTEIMPYMIKVAFEEIKTGNFRGFIKEHNKASRRVLEKSGLKLEKIFNVPGINEKIYSYLITREEYINR